MQSKTTHEKHTSSEEGQQKGFVSDLEHPNKKARVRKKSALVALIFIAVMIGGWLAYRHYSKPTVSAGQHTQFISKLQSLSSGYKYAESESLIQAYLKNRLTPSQRFDTLFALGLDYDGQQNWQEALKYYKQAESTLPKANYSLELQIASDYLHINDKPKAITYYQKAIDTAGKDEDPANNAYIPGYQNIVKMLQSNQAIPSNFKPANSGKAGQ